MSEIKTEEKNTDSSIGAKQPTKVEKKKPDLQNKTRKVKLSEVCAYIVSPPFRFFGSCGCVCVSVGAMGAQLVPRLQATKRPPADCCIENCSRCDYWRSASWQVQDGFGSKCRRGPACIQS